MARRAGRAIAGLAVGAVAGGAFGAMLGFALGDVEALLRRACGG